MVKDYDEDSMNQYDEAQDHLGSLYLSFKIAKFSYSEMLDKHKNDNYSELSRNFLKL